MASDVKVAVLGSGFARSVVLPCLKHVPKARVVGIASRTREHAEAAAAAFGIEHVETDHRALLARARPDLVFIATPPHRHLEMALDALAAGCHVVCEKPMALSAAETASMVEAAAAVPGRLALIDHELRFDPRRESLRELVAAGRFGAVHHAAYVLGGPSRRDATMRWGWWSDRAQGGGILGAIGSHAVDALRVLFGEVAAVRGTLATFVPRRIDLATGEARDVTADDYAAAWLRFESGVLATLALSTVEGERVHRLTIAGSEGAARLDEQAPLLLQFGRDPMSATVLPDELPPSEELAIPPTDWARNFVRFARRIVEAALAGRASVTGAATFTDGHRTQQVLDAIRRSDAEAQWVGVV